MNEFTEHTLKIPSSEPIGQPPNVSPVPESPFVVLIKSEEHHAPREILTMILELTIHKIKEEHHKDEKFREKIQQSK